MKNENRIYLLNASEEVICALSGIEYNTVNHTDNLMDISTFTFNIYETTYSFGELIKTPYYSYLKEMMYIYVSNVGRFRIEDVEIDNDGYSEKKAVSCSSCECELNNQNLVNFKINTGEEDSLEYIASGNVDDITKLAKEYITLYNENKSLSLLDLAISDVPYWKIGYVDKLVANKKFSFSIDSKPIYSFLMDEVATKAKVIFDFDTLNRKINVYSIERIDEIGNTNIVLSYRNLVNTLNIKKSNDGLYTRFNVSGADDLSISSINFNEKRIENLSHLLSEIDEYGNYIFANEDIIRKYNAWYEYRYNEETGRRKEWIEVTKEYNQCLLDIDSVTNRTSEDILDYNQYDTFDRETLTSILENYKNIVNAMTKNYSSGAMDSDGLYIVTDSDFQNSIYYEDYKLYVNIIIPNVKIAIQNLDIVDKNDKIDYIDSFEYDWDMYGTKELQSKIDAWNNCLESLKEYSMDYNSLSENKKNCYTEESYNIKHNSYIKYYYKVCCCKIALNGSFQGIYMYKDEHGYFFESASSKFCFDEEWNKRSAVGRSGKLCIGRQSELKELEDTLTVIENRRKAILEDVNIKSSKFGFTNDELNTIYKLRKDTDYVNENILITSLDDIVSQLDVMEELYQDAIKELDIESQPQYSFTVSVDNLFNIDTFSGWVDDFKKGNLIHLSITDEESVRLRVVTISRNPMIEEDNTLTITFSNMLRSKSGWSDYTNLFNSAVKSSVNQITSTYQKNFDYEGILLSDNLIKALANSSALSSNIKNIVSDTITSKNGVFDNIVSKYIATDEFEARLARVGELEADSAFIKYLETNLIVSGKIDTEKLIASLAEINVANIGSVFTESLQAYTSTTVRQTVDNAYICDLLVGNVTASQVFGSMFTVGDSTGGRIVIDGSLMQFQDKVVNEEGNTEYKTYIQMGTDASGGHSLIIMDESGDTIINGSGITPKAIADGLIVDEMIKKKDTVYSGISADRLNLDELGYEETESGYTLKASRVYFDEENQTLVETLKEMKKTVSNFSVEIFSSDGVVIDNNTTLQARIFDREINNYIEGNFEYQWYKNGVVLEGETSDSIVVRGLDIGDYSNYECAIAYDIDNLEYGVSIGKMYGNVIELSGLESGKYILKYEDKEQNVLSDYESISGIEESYSFEIKQSDNGDEEDSTSIGRFSGNVITFSDLESGSYILKYEDEEENVLSDYEIVSGKSEEYSFEVK